MHIRNVSDLDAYDALPVRDRQRAWDERMSSDDRKRMGELRAFLGFVEASGLPIDLPTVECLDPPSPDIGCRLNPSPYFFELGEVTDEGLAGPALRRIPENGTDYRGMAQPSRTAHFNPYVESAKSVPDGRHSR